MTANNPPSGRVTSIRFSPSERRALDRIQKRGQFKSRSETIKALVWHAHDEIFKQKDAA